jgi:microcystin synthetase protein McyJ
MPDGAYPSPGQAVMDSYAGRFEDVDTPLWLNLGCWKTAQFYPAACTDLARIVAQAARFEAGAQVLDAGCGFAEPARFWATEFNVRVKAVNNDLFQVGVAERRIARLGLADRVSVVHGSATKLKFDLDSFDAVVALESAFHFNTRADFFAEALRVLVPGGRLVLADLASLPGYVQSDHNRQVRRSGRIPESNVCNAEAYAVRVTRAGFVRVAAQSIRNMVFPGMAKLLRELARNGGSPESIAVRMSDDEIAGCIGASLWEDHFGLGDFILVTAVKPG